MKYIGQMKKKVLHQKKHLNSLLIKPAGPDCNMACAYCFYREKEALFPGPNVHRMSEPVLDETMRQVFDQPIPRRFDRLAGRGADARMNKLAKESRDEPSRRKQIAVAPAAVEEEKCVIARLKSLTMT